MKHTYVHLEEFFKLTTWDQDINGPFGLQGTPKGDWAAFTAHIEKLNQECGKGESIKVFFAARHGQAQHNANAEKYGVDKNDDNVQITHPVLDPPLTELGKSQAEALSKAFQREINDRGMPSPQKWFVSPLVRPGETCGIEWGWMFGDKTNVKPHEEDRGHGVPAVVVEELREHLHVHLCDSRLPVHELKKEFPSFTYPENMDDEDTLWYPGSARGRENEQELVTRLGKAVEEILAQAGETTSHSGAIRGLYSVLGVPKRRLETGEMTILVVKVTQSA